MSEKRKVSPELPWKVRLLASLTNFAADVSRRSDHSINRRLFSFLDFKSAPSNTPVKGVESRDISVDTTRDLWFRLYSPASSVTNGGSGVTLPLVFFFHGGGFTFFSADSRPYNEFCHRLARELQAVIISVNYRLAPEHRYPCQYEDGFDVLKFVDGNPSFEGLPANANLRHCFVAGDSAGGNIAHHVTVRACEHEFSNLKIAGLIAIQPFFGGEEKTESEKMLPRAPLISVERADWFWRAFLPEGSDRDHPAVNIFGPNAADVTALKFPATVVFVGGLDPLQDWQKRYHEGLKKCGKEVYMVQYPNAIHSFYVFPELPESALLISEVRDFISMQIRK